MNAPVQFTVRDSGDKIGASDEQLRSPKPGAKVMNILSSKRSAIFTAFALLGITAGFVHVAPSFANEQIQVVASDSEPGIGNRSASRKVRCIMPPAWRRDCEQ
jgi:hypothetical protein